MTTYLLTENGITSKKTLARHKVQIPADWGEVPLTTQRAGYRDVRKLATWDLKPKPVAPPKPVLDPNSTTFFPIFSSIFKFKNQ